MTDLTRDLRANQVDDIVTIIVAESASAVASGATKTARASNASASINALGGIKRALGPLANLAGTNSDTSSTARDPPAARPPSTLPWPRAGGRAAQRQPHSGGVKDIQVNSETQRVTVRGVIRPADIASDNSIRSERLAQMQVLLNGKGVVNDAVRRPSSCTACCSDCCLSRTCLCFDTPWCLPACWRPCFPARGRPPASKKSLRSKACATTSWSATDWWWDWPAPATAGRPCFPPRAWPTCCSAWESR